MKRKGFKNREKFNSAHFNRRDSRLKHGYLFMYTYRLDLDVNRSFCCRDNMRCTRRYYRRRKQKCFRESEDIGYYCADRALFVIAHFIVRQRIVFRCARHSIRFWLQNTPTFRGTKDKKFFRASGTTGTSSYSRVRFRIL